MDDSFFSTQFSWATKFYKLDHFYLSKSSWAYNLKLNVNLSNIKSAVSILLMTFVTLQTCSHYLHKNLEVVFLWIVNLLNGVTVVIIVADPVCVKLWNAVLLCGWNKYTIVLLGSLGIFNSKSTTCGISANPSKITKHMSRIDWRTAGGSSRMTWEDCIVFIPATCGSCALLWARSGESATLNHSICLKSKFKVTQNKFLSSTLTTSCHSCDRSV